MTERRRPLGLARVEAIACGEGTGSSAQWGGGCRVWCREQAPVTPLGSFLEEGFVGGRGGILAISSMCFLWATLPSLCLFLQPGHRSARTCRELKGRSISRRKRRGAVNVQLTDGGSAAFGGAPGSAELSDGSQPVKLCWPCTVPAESIST